MDVQIAEYPFTTIEPNVGAAWVRKRCIHTELGLERCDPKNSVCINGIRYLPVELIDVAGLVPDAHIGRGLGNKFLDELRQADGIIHIVDASGGLDFEGNKIDTKGDPGADLRFLNEEIYEWVYGIIKRDWERMSRTCESMHDKISGKLADKLGGLGIKHSLISISIGELGLDLDKPTCWSNGEIRRLAEKLWSGSKPTIIAANKCDKVIDMMPDAIPTSALSEMALKRAAKNKLIDYEPGSADFDVIGEMSGEQINALDYIKENVLKRFNSTGVQLCLEDIVFEKLVYIVVYPVEDENKFSDKDGNVLPDAYLMRKGSTVRDLSYHVHSDIGEGFIRAIDAKTKRIVSGEKELNDGDVIKIVSSR